MRFRPAAVLLSLLFATVAAPAIAQTSVPSASSATPAPLDPAARNAIVTQLSTELRNRYIYPDVGEKGAAAITAAAASGAYDPFTDLPSFARRLTDDLHGVLHDGHLAVFVARDGPGLRIASIPPDEAGIIRAGRLAGGIAYLEIAGFASPWAFKPALDRAMAGLKGSRAVILDVRGNHGGDPAAVSYLVSHLLPAGKRIEISRIVWRKAATTDVTRKAFFSEPTPVSFAGLPVYVLISGHTFSGGEELAYDIQTLKLGTLVGETTGGGANPGQSVAIGHNLMASIPTGRAESPVTGSNWEGRGVQPDIAVPDADALAAALRRLGRSSAAATIEAASPAPKFTPRTVPLKGSETMLRRLLAGRAAPEPDYTLLAADIGEPGRAAFAAAHRRLQPLGDPQAIRFRRPDAFGFDEFTLVYPDRTLVVAIELDLAGKFRGLIGPDKVSP
jgi:hypothetical protein